MSASNDRLATTLLKPLDRGGILWFLFVGFLATVVGCGLFAWEIGRAHV